MKKLLVLSLGAVCLPVMAQTPPSATPDAGQGLTPQKRAELREAVKAQQMQSMGIGAAEAEPPAQRKLTLQELSEMREQLRRQREPRKPATGTSP